MRKAISTFVHVRERLHPGILERLATGGATDIEIFAHRSHFDYTGGAQLRELASWFASQSGVELCSLHAPLFASGEWGRFDSAPLNIAGRDRRERIVAMDEIKRAIEAAETLPFRFLTLHVGSRGDEFDEHRFEGALSSIEHLHAFARPLGVRILLENIENELTTPEKLLELIHVLHFDDLGVCLDLGHAHIQPGIATAAASLAPRVHAVHVHDNHGMKDDHLWPGEGSIDWPQTMELLRAMPQVPSLVLEIEGDTEGNPEYGKVVPERMKSAWKTMEL